MRSGRDPGRDPGRRTGGCGARCRLGKACTTPAHPVRKRDGWPVRMRGPLGGRCFSDLPDVGRKGRRVRRPELAPCVVSRMRLSALPGLSGILVRAVPEEPSHSARRAPESGHPGRVRLARPVSSPAAWPTSKLTAGRWRARAVLSRSPSTGGVEVLPVRRARVGQGASCARPKRGLQRDLSGPLPMRRQRPSGIPVTLRAGPLVRTGRLRKAAPVPPPFPGRSPPHRPAWGAFGPGWPGSLR